MALAIYPWQETLANELNSLRDHLPNAVLVYGPRGIGTFDLVLRFAKSLMCEHPAGDGTPCAACKGCILTAAMNHPDLRFIVSESESIPRDLPFVENENASSDRKNLYREILIHQTRAMGDFLMMKSHEGGARVIVVYPADQIRSEAAASLLKSLEEPPENTCFLMVADEIDSVLPTIRSRARLIRATAPMKDVALSWLSKMGVENPEESLTAAGGMPLAVFETDSRLILDEKTREAWLAFLSKSREANPVQALAIVPKDTPLPAAAKLFSSWAWDLAGALVGAKPRYFPRYEKELRMVAATTTPAKLYAWINAVRDVTRVCDHPLNNKLIIEEILLAYARAVGH